MKPRESMDDDGAVEPAMRLESNVVFVRHPDGCVEEVELT